MREVAKLALTTNYCRPCGILTLSAIGMVALNTMHVVFQKGFRILLYLSAAEILQKACTANRGRLGLVVCVYGQYGVTPPIQILQVRSLN